MFDTHHAAPALFTFPKGGISAHNTRNNVITDAHSKHPWRWPPSTFEAPTSAWGDPLASSRPTLLCGENRSIPLDTPLPHPLLLRPAAFSNPRPRPPRRTAQQPARKQGGSCGPSRKSRPGARSAPRCTGWRPRSRAPGSRAAKPPASQPARQPTSYGEGGPGRIPKGRAQGWLPGCPIRAAPGRDHGT